IGAVRTSREIGGFAQVQSQLRSMGRAPSMQDIARGQVPRNTRRSDSGTYSPDGRYSPNGSCGGQRAGQIEPPSSRLATYQQRDGFFAIQYPENWRAYEPDNGFGVTIVPEGGVVDTGNGQQSIIYGVIVNHYDPFEARNSRQAASLETANQDLVAQ